MVLERARLRAASARSGRAGGHFDDLPSQRGYNRVAAYGQSKLANQLFTYELQRRLASHGTTIAAAAHPGGSKLVESSPKSHDAEVQKRADAGTDHAATLDLIEQCGGLGLRVK